MQDAIEQSMAFFYAPAVCTDARQKQKRHRL